MATETEVERLVVRLIGDDTDYRRMMQDAVTASGELNTASNEVAQAQRTTQEALRASKPAFEDLSGGIVGTNRAVKFLGIELMNAGLAFDAIDGSIGAVLGNLGRFTVMVGEALHGIHALETISSRFKIQPDISSLAGGAAKTAASLLPGRQSSPEEEREKSSALMEAVKAGAAPVASSAWESKQAIAAETELASASAAANVSTETLSTTVMSSTPVWQTYAASVSAATGAITAEEAAARAATLSIRVDPSMMTGASTITSLTAAEAEAAASAGAAMVGLHGAIAVVGTAAAIAAIPIAVVLSYIYSLGKYARDAEAAEKSLASAIKSGREEAAKSPTGNVWMRDKRSLEEATSFAKEQYEKQSQIIADAEQAKSILENEHATEWKARRDSYDDLLGAFPEFWNLITRWESGDTTLRAQQADEMLEVNRKIAVGKSFEKVATEQYIVSLGKEITAIAAANEEGKKYTGGKNATITSLEQQKAAVQFANDSLMEAKKSLRAAELGPRPGRELETSFLAAQEAPSQNDYPGREADQLRILDELRKVDAKNVENAYLREADLMEKRIARIGLLGQAEARQAAIDQALAEGKTEDQARYLGDMAARQKLREEEDSYAQSLERTRIEQKYFASELTAARNPRNEEIRAALEAAKAYELWCQQNKDLVVIKGEEQRAIMQANAAHALEMKYLQEGAEAQEKYMEPLDRMIEAQSRINKINDLGGFGKGAAGARVYQKSLEDAYAQAHKDYTAQFMGQKYDAVVGNTSEATRALQEYTLGVTPIPIESINEKKEPSWSDPIIQPVNDMAKGIQELVQLSQQQLRMFGTSPLTEEPAKSELDQFVWSSRFTPKESGLLPGQPAPPEDIPLKEEAERNPALKAEKSPILEEEEVLETEKNRSLMMAAMLDTAQKTAQIVWPSRFPQLSEMHPKESGLLPGQPAPPEYESSWKSKKDLPLVTASVLGAVQEMAQTWKESQVQDEDGGKNQVEVLVQPVNEMMRGIQELVQIALKQLDKSAELPPANL